jgi:hypothetical protein
MSVWLSRPDIAVPFRETACLSGFSIGAVVRLCPALAGGVSGLSVCCPASCPVFENDGLYSVLSGSLPIPIATWFRLDAVSGEVERSTGACGECEVSEASPASVAIAGP